MKTPKIINDKKTRHYKAGDVVLMEYEGAGKPCDRAMAMLLTPFTAKNGCYKSDGDFFTMFAIDLDKEEFIPLGPITNATCNMARATPKLKAWFFEQILKLYKTIK